MKYCLATFLTLLLMLFTANSAFTMPAAHIIHALNNSVFRVQVHLPNGKLGLGSAVVVAKNEVITNCHVVSNASTINLVINGELHPATAIKADWKHDLCMLTVEDLNLPAVQFGASRSLQYETAIFTVGFPDEVQTPVNTHGSVKGLFPMDDSVIIRASSPFKPGASGGGAFDDAGRLVGIITLKSRGEHAYYYFMPVEWVQALLQKPAQVLGINSEKPFWANEAMAKPYFMQVVKPYLNHEWKALKAIASEWAQTEPATAESWFYLAMAEFATKDFNEAEEHLRKALALNEQHIQAKAYLEKIAGMPATSPIPDQKLALLD